MIYLDNAATSWPKPEKVYQSMDEFMRAIGANPGRGGHKLSMQSGKIILSTREKLAEFFNGEDSRQFIFTLNATDSLNMVTKGLLKEGDHVITTSLEHNSVIRPLHRMSKKGVELEILNPNHECIMDVDKVEKKIKENTRLIAMTHASNVIGSLQPIKEIGNITSNYQYTKFMVDAAQTAGIVPIDVQEYDIDFLAFPGHKGLLGPQGVGGLYISTESELDFWREGGTGSKSESAYHPEELPDKFESGTPNTPGISGLEAGIDFINEQGIERLLKKKMKLFQSLLNGLKNIPGVEIYGSEDINKRVPVVAFNMEDENSQEISFALDQAYNIASRGGLHCAPLVHEFLGNIDRGAVRLSLGAFNTKEDIANTLSALEEIAKKLN